MNAPKILCVDDSMVIRMLVKKVFSAYECTVLEAGNGKQGLELAMVEIPDLIILDVTMPHINGIEALKRIKGFPPLAKAQIIMLTAESKKETVVELIKLGINAYIVKPFSAEQLIEKAGRLIKLTPKTP